MITFGQLQKDIDALTEQEQDKLAAYLTMLSNSREPGYDEKLTDRLAEDASESWIAHKA
jgi:hypothetical protein